MNRQNLLAAVDNFTYLGNTLSGACAYIDMEINSRKLVLFRVAFGRLMKRCGIGKVCEGILLSYSPTHQPYVMDVTWTVYQRHTHPKKLNRFHLNCMHENASQDQVARRDHIIHHVHLHNTVISVL